MHSEPMYDGAQSTPARVSMRDMAATLREANIKPKWYWSIARMRSEYCAVALVTDTDPSGSMTLGGPEMNTEQRAYARHLLQVICNVHYATVHHIAPSHIIIYVAAEYVDLVRDTFDERWYPGSRIDVMVG